MGRRLEQGGLDMALVELTAERSDGPHTAPISAWPCRLLPRYEPRSQPRDRIRRRRGLPVLSGPLGPLSPSLLFPALPLLSPEQPLPSVAAEEVCQGFVGLHGLETPWLLRARSKFSAWPATAT